MLTFREVTHMFDTTQLLGWVGGVMLTLLAFAHTLIVTQHDATACDGGGMLTYLEPAHVSPKHVFQGQVVDYQVVTTKFIAKNEIIRCNLC